MSKGLFITIEGLDGCGKSTQTELLKNKFEALGRKVKFVHFPIYEKEMLGDLISEFLRGELGNINQVNPKLISLVFAENRRLFSATLQQWINEGYVVIADRYVYSNIACQCAKLSDSKEINDLKNWIENLEYNINKIPKPDISIYLKVPIDFVKNNIIERAIKNDREYLNGKDDIHESDFSFQMKVSRRYNSLCFSDDLFGVDCFDVEHEMLSVDEIHEKIYNYIQFYLRNEQ